MDRTILTGCDSNTEWQLPWFINNFRKHNPDLPLTIADFGMSDDAVTEARLNCDVIIDMRDNIGRKNWMKKPHAIASSPAKETVWVDTDCEVRENIEPIFNKIEDDKLLMAKDKPWTTRRKATWYNSGVVGVRGRPSIIIEWAKKCHEKDIQGDQEVLYWMMGGDSLRWIKYVADLPHRYNVLRLDLIDKTEPKKIAIMHWTGAKGNIEIQRMMKNEK